VSASEQTRGVADGILQTPAHTDTEKEKEIIMTDKKITPTNPETLPAQSDADPKAEPTERKTAKVAARVVSRTVLRQAKAKR
jgi:hypothetical protein